MAANGRISRAAGWNANRHLDEAAGAGIFDLQNDLHGRRARDTGRSTAGSGSNRMRWGDHTRSRGRSRRGWFHIRRGFLGRLSDAVYYPSFRDRSDCQHNNANDS